jgi:hypothetical protein
VNSFFIRIVLFDFNNSEQDTNRKRSILTERSF